MTSHYKRQLSTKHTTCLRKDILAVGLPRQGSVAHLEIQIDECLSEQKDAAYRTGSLQL